MMTKKSYFNPEEEEINREYLQKGYVIRPAGDLVSLNLMREHFKQLSSEVLGVEYDPEDVHLLDLIHKKVAVSELNEFRLKIIRGINALPNFRRTFYQIARPYLDLIVGNEVAMQLRINLSIQLPFDESSLLPIHADTWSGDSPFEVVAWIPLMDCYRTKSMYILPPKHALELDNNLKKMSFDSSEELYESVESKVKWIEIKYGEVLLFNQALPHGNRVNSENETRWSMNCRFKGVFTPYGDKNIGEFFEPITLRASSIIGMNYKLPKLF